MKKMLITFLCVSLIYVAYYYLSTPLYELRVNVERYTTINIPKNQGVYRVILSLIKDSTIILPKPSAITIDIPTDEEVGTGYPLVPVPTMASRKTIKSSEELVTALRANNDETEIILKPGVYRLEGKKIPIKKSEHSQTTIKGEKAGQVVIELVSSEGLYIDTNNITIENLIFKGLCDFDVSCSHAVHIVGNADNLVIQNNQFINFNAHIKSNGAENKQSGKREFPDNVRILNNSFFNEWVRDTNLPVTPLDIVGGNDWLIAGNLIADFSKRNGNRVSYGAFMKGGGERGIFEKNLVICSMNLGEYDATDVRIGLSFGGGGTGSSFCEANECDFEHKDGLMIENTILNCANDVAVYINKGENITVTNNILANTLGLDVRYPQSNVNVFDNIIQGRIKARNGATLKVENNSVVRVMDKVL